MLFNLLWHRPFTPAASAVSPRTHWFSWSLVLPQLWDVYDRAPWTGGLRDNRNSLLTVLGDASPRPSCWEVRRHVRVSLPPDWQAAVYSESLRGTGGGALGSSIELLFPLRGLCDHDPTTSKGPPPDTIPMGLGLNELTWGHRPSVGSILLGDPSLSCGGSALARHRPGCTCLVSCPVCPGSSADGPGWIQSRLHLCSPRVLIHVLMG